MINPIEFFSSLSLRLLRVSDPREVSNVTHLHEERSVSRVQHRKLGMESRVRP
jgi:hypothetical protein